MLVSPHYSELSPRRKPAAGVHPDPNSPGYRATVLRHPKQPLVIIPQTLTELTAPVYGDDSVGKDDHDLTAQHGAAPLGQRIVVSGRVLDDDGRPVPNTLIEVWQANAAGRYAHKVDQWNAPVDPNFTGAGRTLTDADGRYTFVTVQPGAYPWRNHHNAWRPAHIHFSLFGQAFATRLVTQMYFPGDPLLPLDPIFNAVPDERARNRMVSAFDLSLTTPEWALGYRFDIVLRGRNETPMEASR
jgi:protocatechuate 3,4-dioxygenase, beta subunit